MTTEYLEQPLNGDVVQPKSDIYTPTAAQKYRLGTRYHKADGRTFHYAQASSAANLIAGNLIQSAVDGFIANEQEDLVIATSSAVGDDFAYATTVTDTLTKDFMKDGWYSVSLGTAAQGRGQLYQIKSNPAGAAGSTKFTLYDTVKVAITAGSAQATLLCNPYKNVCQRPTTETGFPVGVAPCAVTASYYFWLQTWGICNCLNKTANTPGQQVISDNGLAGAMGISGGSEAEPVIGIACMTCDTTDNGLIMLMLNP